MKKISFLDLNKVHKQYQSDINQSVKKVLASGKYLLDRELLKFEESYANFENVKHAIGVGSGLDALTILLLAIGIEKGDEIIVPAHTFVATWFSVTKVGAIPVPVEPDSKTYNINHNLIENEVTTKTKAIIVVNLYGQVADLEPINKICKKHNLFLLEDAAQSHGTMYKGKYTTAFSDGVATSFYPGKNLGCMGDGGAILTNNDDIASKAKKLRNYGSLKKYEHIYVGFNSRLDEIQSAVLNIKLKYLKTMNKQRKNIANFYDDNLIKNNLQVPYKLKYSDHSYHLYVIRTKYRDYLQKKLLEEGIQVIVHYPVPPHLQKCYQGYKFKSLSLTERICSEILSLPIYPNMEKCDYEVVVQKVNQFLEEIS